MSPTPRKLIGWAAAALSLVCLYGAPCHAQQWARDMFQEFDHDFGTVTSGSDTAFTFEFTNKYKETVHVKSVRSTCGCTIPSVVKDVVTSREKSGIVATFNTKAFTGARSAKITVVFDRPFFAEVELTVHGTILSDVSFEPSNLAFGEVPAGSETSQSLTVDFRNRPNIRLSDVRSLCSDLSVRLSGPTRMNNIIRYQLDVKLKETVAPGDLNEQLTLITNDPRLTNIPVPITGHVRAPLDVKPESMHFGPLAPGGSDSQRITLRADEPFTILKVTCPDARCKFKVLNEKESKFHFVKVDFTDDKEATGTFKFPIEIETSLGDKISSTCLVTGEIKSDEEDEAAGADEAETADTGASE